MPPPIQVCLVREGQEWLIPIFLATIVTNFAAPNVICSDKSSLITSGVRHVTQSILVLSNSGAFALVSHSPRREIEAQGVKS
jgi:hypothetical protein